MQKVVFHPKPASFCNGKKYLAILLFQLGVAIIVFLLVTGPLADQLGMKKEGLSFDFNSYYLASKILRDSPQALYSLDKRQEYLTNSFLQEDVLIHYSQSLAFLYPPFSAILVSPLVYVGYQQALNIWAALSLVCIFFIARRLGEWANASGATDYSQLVAAMIYFNVATFWAIYLGQISIFMCLGLVFILEKIMKNQWALAALILALITHMKPQHFIPLTAFFFFLGPREFKLTLVASHLVILLLSMAVMGKDIFWQYAQFIASIKHTSFGGSPFFTAMPNFVGIASLFYDPQAVRRIAMPLYIGVCLLGAIQGYRLRDASRSWMDSLPLMMLTASFFSPWSHIPDALLWAPMVVLILTRLPRKKHGLLLPVFIFPFIGIFFAETAMRVLLIYLIGLSMIPFFRKERSAPLASV